MRGSSEWHEPSDIPWKDIETLITDATVEDNRLSSSNYDMAAANWLRAAQEYKRIEEAEKEKEVRAYNSLAVDRGVNAIERAAAAYELAAEAYAEKNAKQAAGAAGASEKAAGCREKLAKRK